MRITGQEYLSIVCKYIQHRTRNTWEDETQLCQSSQAIRRKSVFCFHERICSLRVTF